MGESTYKHITAEEFAKIDKSTVTVVDLREPDEVLISAFENAINIPFSGGFDKLDTITKDKPVVVLCRVGDWSEEVAEILSDRGYDVLNLDGGYKAYLEYRLGEKDNNVAKKKIENLPFIDAKGLKCPGPIVKVADYLRNRPIGETIRVEATEDAFVSDIKRQL